MTNPTRFVALLADDNGDDFEAEVVLATEYDKARTTAEYWKASHLAGNIAIASLREQLAACGARLAEAVALLWNVRPYVYGLDRIKAIDAFLGPADSAPVQESAGHE